MANMECRRQEVKKPLPFGGVAGMRVVQRTGTPFHVAWFIGILTGQLYYLLHVLCVCH
jgi:hypothetical protein